MKRLEVLQDEIADCGVASLLSIIRYYNGNASLESLRFKSLTTSDGVNAYNLIECAKYYNLDAKGIKEVVLPDENLPYIAHLNTIRSTSHFVVIYKINKDYIEVMDPSCGFKKIKCNDFYKMFTGNIIQFFPRGKIPNEAPSNKLLSTFKSLILNNSKKILLLLVFNILFVIFSIVETLFIKFLNLNISYFKIITVFIMISLLTNYLKYQINNLSNKISNNISDNLLDLFFKHIFRLPLKYIHIKDSNEIVKRVVDLDTIKNVLVNIIITLLLNIFIFLSLLFIVIFINRFLLIYIFSYFIIMLIIAILMYKKQPIKLKKVIDNETNYNSNIIDYISGLTSIHHSRATDKFLNDVNYYKTTYLNSSYEYNKSLEFIDLIKNNIVSIKTIVLNAYLFMSVINQRLTFENYIILSFLLDLIFSNIDSIIGCIPSYLYIRTIMNKVNEFFTFKEEDNSKTPFKPGNISFENVTFGYTPYYRIFKNLNLNISNHEKVIIKGKSGVGKSTLFKLLNKEYLDYKGIIKINGLNLKTINTSDLRDNISYSSQKEKIFLGTIRDNILMGNNISESKLKKIIELTKVYRLFKNRPLKLDTYLYGDNSLSGGEKQLIFLARALVRNSNILILDETLSEVNEELENKILNNIFNYFKDKTIIYITHKQSKNYHLKTIYV